MRRLSSLTSSPAAGLSWRTSTRSEELQQCFGESLGAGQTQAVHAGRHSPRSPAGCLPTRARYLLDNGLIHGDCMTVTGKTLAANVQELPPLTAEQEVILPVSSPIKPSGHLQILYGNLAPEGAVAKITGKEGERFSGVAKVTVLQAASAAPCLYALAPGLEDGPATRD